MKAIRLDCFFYLESISTTTINVSPANVSSPDFTVSQTERIYNGSFPLMSGLVTFAAA